MAQMTVAATTVNFGAGHEPTPVLFSGDAVSIDGIPIAWPARARIELCLGRKQRLAAADAVVGACVLEVPIGTGKGAFRAVFPRDPKLFRCQEDPPGFLSFLDLVRHSEPLSYSKSARIFLIRFGT